MKNRGLKNRFSDRTQYLFQDIYWKCWKCYKTHANCSHHIISPSSMCYKDGDFNNSPLNLARLNNFECHIGQVLHKPEIEQKFLKMTYDYLIGSGYVLKDNDWEFIKAYKQYYKDLLNSVK